METGSWRDPEKSDFKRKGDMRRMEVQSDGGKEKKDECTQMGNDKREDQSGNVGTNI